MPTREPGNLYGGFPQVLPGSREILFTVQAGVSREDAQVDVLSFRTGQRKTIQKHAFFGRYLTSGHLVFMREDTLYAAPFNLGRLEITGVPQPVLEDVNLPGLALSANFDVSQNGTLVYMQG
jgi:hypothetical protein